jgi:hypothetical protein
MVEKIATEVFPKFEKWDSFLELIHQKSNITDYFISGYRSILKGKVAMEFDTWKVDFDNRLDVFFYPSGYPSRKSLELWIENGFQLSFWVNLEFFDVEKVKVLVNNEKFILETLLTHSISISELANDPYIFKVNIDYDLPFNVQHNFDKLVFFANKELPDEILRVIRPIITNDRIIELFHRINTQCLKLQ